eukprot:28797-Amphidinium_carterae.1
MERHKQRWLNMCKLDSILLFDVSGLDCIQNKVAPEICHSGIGFLDEQSKKTSVSGRVIISVAHLLCIVSPKIDHFFRKQISPGVVTQTPKQITVMFPKYVAFSWSPHAAHNRRMNGNEGSAGLITERTDTLRH